MWSSPPVITSYSIHYTKLYEEIEGQEAELLGRLARFIRQIRTWRDDLPRARPGLP